MALFDNVNPEEILLFVWDFKMTLEASGTLAASTELQYLCMLLRGEELLQLETLYVELGSTIIAHLDRIVWV